MMPSDRQTVHVAKIFNEMVKEYDNLKDPWYAYTFDHIEHVINHYLKLDSMSENKPVSIDIGCGTGIQSLLLGRLGYKVQGIDIADKLVEIAKPKLVNAGIHDAVFHISDATQLPFQNCSADVANCCGPTLSFIPNWRGALEEISRCLKPSGKLLLEVEGQWTIDLAWELFNSLTWNCLEYDKNVGEVLKEFRPPWDIGSTISYAFILESGRKVEMPLKLFTRSELNKELSAVNLRITNLWGMHCLTNLIPSTLLHRADLSKPIRSLFSILARIESKINGYWPVNSHGCSLLVLAEKMETRKQGNNYPRINSDAG